MILKLKHCFYRSTTIWNHWLMWNFRQTFVNLRQQTKLTKVGCLFEINSKILHSFYIPPVLSRIVNNLLLVSARSCNMFFLKNNVFMNVGIPQLSFCFCYVVFTVPLYKFCKYLVPGKLRLFFENYDLWEVGLSEKKWYFVIIEFLFPIPPIWLTPQYILPHNLDILLPHPTVLIFMVHLPNHKNGGSGDWNYEDTFLSNLYSDLFSLRNHTFMTSTWKGLSGGPWNLSCVSGFSFFKQ